MNDNNANKLTIYMHAGSGNHGCEAIANSLGNMISADIMDCNNGRKPILLTYVSSEDKKYSIKDMYDIVEERKFSKHKIMHVLYFAYRLLSKDYESFIRYRYKGLVEKTEVAVSIGGDNYCYDVMLNDLFLSNSAFNKAGARTVLLGCSIEPKILENVSVLNDLRKYSCIVARESLTYEALKNCLPDTQKIILVPDPAFYLKPCETKLPMLFECEDGVVGINISPMIESNENVPGITVKNYEKLIEHIINDSNMNVALIPHVVWEKNDDRIPISALYEKYKDTGRVCKIEDADCASLKYTISKCRFFIGARTHSTIAAYSTEVPTLVVGYSVKARGIARDIFGTDKDYVLPVQNLREESELSDAFDFLRVNETQIKNKLCELMPGYIEKSKQNGRIIVEMLNNEA